jgi:peptidoglycan/LPS O-acetylase OafA/YrhL
MHHADMSRWPGGFFGVDVFFAISGYLITTLLLREWERSGGIWLRGFYMRRFLRLMPALAAMVFLALVAARLLNYVQPLREAVVSLLYVMDIYAPLMHRIGGLFAHTWSLAVEEQFYLVWPLVLLIGLRRRWPMAWIAVGIAVAAAALTALLTGQGSPHRVSDVYRSPFTHIPEMAVGVVLAFVLASPTGRRRLRFLASTAVAFAAVAVLLIAALKVRESERWLYRGGFTAAAVVFAALVGHVVLAPTSFASRVLALAPIEWLGRRSYGFYLWHYPVLRLLLKHVSGVYVHAAVGLIVTLVVTELSWRFIEQPFLRLKERKFEPAAVRNTGIPDVAA